MTSLPAFLALLLPLVLSPGPVGLALAGIGMSYGLRPGIPFWFGVQAAALLAGTASALGLAQFLIAVPAAYKAIQIAGIAYVTWLAWKFVMARPKPAGDADRVAGFFSGILITLLNPKFYVMVIAVFSQFMHPSGKDAWQLVIGLWLCIVFSASVWLGGGALFKPLLKSERALRIQSVAFGISLFAVAAWMAWRSF